MSLSCASTITSRTGNLGKEPNSPAAATTYGLAGLVAYDEFSYGIETNFSITFTAPAP